MGEHEHDKVLVKKSELARLRKEATPNEMGQALRTKIIEAGSVSEIMRLLEEVGVRVRRQLPISPERTSRNE